MIVTPDYTNQLQHIVEALNRPTTSTWINTTISLVVGFILGLAGNWSRDMLAERRRVDEIRRIAYVDIFEMIFQIESDGRIVNQSNSGIMRSASPQAQEKLRLTLTRQLLRDRGEAYVRARPDLYMQLPERAALDKLYRALHEMADIVDFDDFYINHVVLMSHLSEIMKTKTFDKKIVDKLVRPGTFERLTQLVNDYDILLA